MQQKPPPTVVDHDRIQSITDADLEQRINNLTEVIAGLTSPEDSEIFQEAIRLQASPNSLPVYREVLRALRKERRRRAANPAAKIAAVPWTEFKRAFVEMTEYETPEAWERYRALSAADEQGRTAEDYHDLYVAAANDEHWRNSRYQVTITRSLIPDGEGGSLEMVHLSIKRNDQQAVHDWRDLQRIKNELVGEECEGVELYPAESRCIDTANQYHLWVVRSDTYRWPVGWHEGRVKLDPAEANETGAGQRAFEA